MRLIDADRLIDDLKHDVVMDQDSLDYEELTDLNRENIQFDKDCKQNAIDLLQHAPTIEPERKTGRWIPCSERLPKKHGESYIVTISDGAIYSAALQWDINRKRWYLSFLNNGEILIDYIDDVIAWMPLPECYRGENNG